MYTVIIILYFIKGRNKLLMCVTITISISIDGTLVTTFEVFIPFVYIFQFLIVDIIYYFQAYYKLF